jgi:GTP 3',8-cyclase
MNILGKVLKPLSIPALYILTGLAITRHPLTCVAIEISSHCNRRCNYCPNKTYQREIAFLDERLFYKIIDELKEKRFKGSLTFNGYNEPLLDKRLASFLEYARKGLPHAYLYLNTNGDFLNYSLWNKLRVAGLDKANVTQYNREVSINIQNLLSSLDNEEKKHIYVKLFDASTANNRAGLVKLENNAKVPLKEFCIRPFYQLQISYKGKALLCCNDYFGVIEMGDINSQNLIDIWNNRKFQAYRKRLLFKDRASLDLCNKCDTRQIHPYPPFRIPTFLTKNQLENSD